MNCSRYSLSCRLASVFALTDTVEGLDQTRVFYIDLGYFRPTSPRTPTREILHCLGVVLGHGRTARFRFTPWCVTARRLRPTTIVGVLILFRVGRPLHPHHKALASQFEPLDAILPAGSIPFALSPSGLIPSPRFSEFSPSPALVQHLRSILPEHVPSVSRQSPDPESDSNPIKAATSNESGSGQQRAGGFALPTIPVPAVNLNMDMRNLKWGWPGYLTFGKNSKDKEKQKNAKATVDEPKPDSESETKPDGVEEGRTSSDTPVIGNGDPDPDPPEGGEKVGVGVEVDTASLADAMESENNHSGSSSEHSPGVCTPSEAPQSPTTGAIGPELEDDATPTAVQPSNHVPASQEEMKEIPRQSTPGPPSPSPEELPPAISEPPAPPVTFSQTMIYLAPPGRPLLTTKRRLYHLTVCRPSPVYLYPCGSNRVFLPLAIQTEDITVAIADDKSLSLELQEDSQPVAEVALKVAEGLLMAMYDEERRR